MLTGPRRRLDGSRLPDAAAALVVAALALSVAAAAPPVGTGRPEASARADSAQIASAIAARLRGPRPGELGKDEWAAVARLYERPGGASAPAPLWLDDGRLASRATDLAALLGRADTLGLRPSDYAADAVAAAVRAATSAANDAAGVAALARADVLLTGSFVTLMHDLLTGRVNPRTVERSWHIGAPPVDLGTRAAAALDSVRAGRTVAGTLATLRPDYGVYAPLVQALGRYRALERAGGWAPLPGGATMRPGDAGARVTALRRRLAAEGYLTSAEGGDTLDAALAGAVAGFQRRHGLAEDSLVGPGTRRALDVPAERRVRQIEANLERLRWLPSELGARFVVVNVPAFSLYAYQGHQRVLTMRVVVGDELVSRRTPIFADTMEYIEFGPYWNVPRSIAVNEILPKARSDLGYLARNNYQILRGWGDDAPVVNPRSLSNAALFSSRYRVRQLPGPDNALGRVKFMFPNDYAVYFHDTPSKARFAEADRAVSHGCVRVADPEALAAYVLQDRADWPRDRISATLEAGRRLRVDLDDPVPVYLVYLTAFVRDGEPAFRDDIYDRDDRLVRALAALPRSGR